MTRPPENIEASELWLALTAVPRPHRIVDFPRNLPGTNEPVGKLAIWPLTQEEQMASNAEADRFMKELLKNPQKKDEANLGYHHTFTNETAVQVLFRACRDPNSKNFEKPAFPSPGLLRAKLTADEIGVLFNSYLRVQSEVGPIVAYLSDEEMDAWLERIGEGGSLFPLDSLSWEMREQLLRHSAFRLRSFLTDTPSAGGPPDGSSTDIETGSNSSSDTSESGPVSPA